MERLNPSTAGTRLTKCTNESDPRRDSFACFTPGALQALSNVLCGPAPQLSPHTSFHYRVFLIRGGEVGAEGVGVIGSDRSEGD